MNPSPGVQLASLLMDAFASMVEQVVTELAKQGHPGVTATLEFALAAIDDGAQAASSLSRKLGVSKQAAAKTVMTLEQLGYVQREPDPADARRKRLAVTARGHEMTAMGAAIFDTLRLQWVASVGAPQAAEVEKALQVLVREKRSVG